MSATATQNTLFITVVSGEQGEALEEFLQGLSAETAHAIVVLVREGDWPARCRAHSPVPVLEVQGRQTLRRQCLYLLPAGLDASFDECDLVVHPPDHPTGTLDSLLRSLADHAGARGISVILKGRGVDGALGLKALKEAGGSTISQPSEVRGIRDPMDEMPRAAIETGFVDFVLSPEKMGRKLALLATSVFPPPLPEELAVEHLNELNTTLRELLTFVRIRTGHDFGAYKRPTLYRRIARRMQVCECDSLDSYQSYLREHHSEVQHLIREFMISVTSFFRDAKAFEALEAQVLPRLFEQKSEEPIRIWVAGCATGEEAYSLAMLLIEQSAKANRCPPIQIFATDIDDDALSEARAGRYLESIEADVSRARLDRFFKRDGDHHYRVTKQLRDMVLFSPHSVLRDPPFSRLDLLTCRNLLIYLTPEAQEQAFAMFHFGLKQDGFLMLGSSESTGNAGAGFRAVDEGARLYQRKTTPHLLPAPNPLSGVPRQQMVAAGLMLTSERPTSLNELHHRVLEQSGPSSLLVNDELDVVHMSAHVERFLKLSSGEPTRQLLRLVDSGLRLELRGAVYAARQSGALPQHRFVRVEDRSGTRLVYLRVSQAAAPDLGRNALLVTFDELEAPPTVRVAGTVVEPLMREMEEDMHRTREQLRSTIEQYETSLEELKSSNEELHAINEELRSATEELETSKEELQSVNEELTTVNHELKGKVDEVSRTNSDVQNLIASTDIGVIFLDREMCIKRFTPRAQDVFNLIAADIGRPLAHLTHQLDLDSLPQLAQEVLSTLRGLERSTSSKAGRRYLARLLPYRSIDDHIEGVVLTFLDVTELHQAIEDRSKSELARHTSDVRLGLALRSAPLMVFHVDPGLHVTWGYLMGKKLASPGQELPSLAPGQAERFAAASRRAAASGRGEQVELDFQLNGQVRTYDLRVEPQSELGGFDVVGFDITPSKQAERALLEDDRRKNEFLATLSHELRNPLTPLRLALEIANLAPQGGAQQERSRAVMTRQVNQLSKLIDGLLDLSRITHGKIELERRTFDATLLVDAALEAAGPLVRERQHLLKVELPKEPVLLNGDQSRLVQVLTNLVNNAAKYTPDGGRIDLALKVDEPRNQLLMSVRDSGVGIAPELLPKVFEMFVQSRGERGRAMGGLGIGLNLVRRLVELHGGEVTAASDGPQKGSQFTVRLPLPERTGP